MLLNSTEVFKSHFTVFPELSFSKIFHEFKKIQMHRTLFPASSLVEVLMSNEMVPKQELKYLSAYHVPGTFLVTEDT